MFFFMFSEMGVGREKEILRASRHMLTCASLLPLYLQQLGPKLEAMKTG